MPRRHLTLPVGAGEQVNDDLATRGPVPGLSKIDIHRVDHGKEEVMLTYVGVTKRTGCSRPRLPNRAYLR